MPLGRGGAAPGAPSAPRPGRPRAGRNLHGFRPVSLGIVGTVLCAASVLATVGRPELGPVWYPIALTLIAYPTSRLGAAWQRRRGQ